MSPRKVVSVKGRVPHASIAIDTKILYIVDLTPNHLLLNLTPHH
jgi:hypothetical protein